MFFPWDRKRVAPHVNKSAAILITSRKNFIKFYVGFWFSLKFRWRLSVKLGLPLRKLGRGWQRVLIFRWGLIFIDFNKQLRIKSPPPASSYVMGKGRISFPNESFPTMTMRVIIHSWMIHFLKSMNQPYWKSNKVWSIVWSYHTMVPCTTNEFS